MVQLHPRALAGAVPVHPAAAGYRLQAAVPHPSGSSIAVLLCHGFSSSPASVRPWAESLATHGYHVAAPRLPGHGTAWREMNITTWTDWYDRVEQEYVQLAAEHDRVLLGGLSMGGGLAIRLAQQHPEVPALALVNPSIGTYDPTYRLLPVLSRVLPSIQGVAGDVSKPLKPEYPSYDRTPLRAAASMRQMWRDIVAGLNTFTSPMLVFRSTVDHVVDDASVDLLRRLPQVTVRMLEQSYHVATLDHDAERIGRESTEFFDRYAEDATEPVQEL